MSPEQPNADHGDRQHERANYECSHQKVDPTANLKVNFFAGRRLLSSTPKRCGLYAKINRNGTFNTGMKKRISAPVEVLNALVSPIFRWNAGGAFGSTNAVLVIGSKITALARIDALVDVFLPREPLPDVADLAGVVEQHQAHRAGDIDQVLGVEQQRLVAAEDQARSPWIARTDRADVVAADACTRRRDTASR